MNEEIMRQLGFGDQVARIKQGLCSWCGTPIQLETFRDECSRREWRISGMCQLCQDETFRSAEEPEIEDGRPDEP